MSDVTRLLQAARAGDRHAAAALLPLVYDELRQLAAARMAAEDTGHTLNPTALVHEAYLRLVGGPPFDGRGHFFAAAAEAMRRILVNHARDRKRLKRGGGRLRLELLDQADSLAEDPDLVLSLDERLTRLGGQDATAARVAHLHLFGGLSVGEAAASVGVSRAAAYRNCKYAGLAPRRPGKIIRNPRDAFRVDGAWRAGVGGAACRVVSFVSDTPFFWHERHDRHDITQTLHGAAVKPLTPGS
jgi:RNA polymerase sigma factor (TIGR02999 family)